MIELNEVQSAYIEAQLKVMGALVDGIARAEADLNIKRDEVKSMWADAMGVLRRDLGVEVSDIAQVVRTEDGKFCLKNPGDVEDACPQVEELVESAV